MKVLFNYILKYIQNLKHKSFYGWTGYTQSYFIDIKRTTMAPHIDHITSIFEDKKGVPEF